MKKIRLNLVCILSYCFCFFTIGCASTAKGPSYTEVKTSKPKPNEALIYIFRNHAQPTAWGSKIKVGENQIGTLNQKGFTWTYTQPGKQLIRAIWPGMSGQSDSNISIDVQGGKTYYLELTGISKVSGFSPNLKTAYFKTGSGLNLVRPEHAIKKLKECCKSQKSDKN